MYWIFYVATVCVFNMDYFVVANERPIGVSPQLVPLYEEKSEFECLDGSKKIAFDQINDEYCDCADGSDEPGTAACSNGKFYCQNSGHRPLTIPSSHVNDFICDCCDGSDEWNSGVECPNICQAQGVQAREEAKLQRQIQEAGYAKRVQLAKSGAELIQEKRKEIEKSRKEIEEIQKLKDDLESKKNTAEERERGAKEKYDNAYNILNEEHRAKKDNELFTEISNNASMLTLPQFTEYVKFKGDFTTEQLKKIFGEHEAIDAEMFRSISDKVRELLKTLVQNQLQKEENNTTEPTHFSTEQKEELLEDEEIHEESHEPKSVDIDKSDVDDDLELPKPPYDEVTQAVINDADTARRNYDELMRKISDLENTIRNGESSLEFEYGPDHAWAPLKGNCVELATSQYVYRLCLFERAVQKDRNGPSEVHLGYWGHWSGPENNKFSVQVYDKGQGCWNGPERSTRVAIECGADLELIEASEPSKCEYHFTLKSPAACENPANILPHDEF